MNEGSLQCPECGSDEINEEVDDPFNLTCESCGNEFSLDELIGVGCGHTDTTLTKCESCGGPLGLCKKCNRQVEAAFILHSREYQTKTICARCVYMAYGCTADRK